MTHGDSALPLREQGVILLRDAFPKEALRKLEEAAVRCFEAATTESALPERYKFNPHAHSALLTALQDFGCGSEDLVAPLVVADLDEMFADVMGGGWRCGMDQSWVRKKFAPGQTPNLLYFPQSWHQDGALGVQFPVEPGPAVPMTELLTCWIPLTACGKDSPALEFVRQPLPNLLHYKELDDSLLRRRFPAEDFWAPALEVGDGLVFLNSTLHRTHAVPEMRYNRLSVEYRIFPQR